jgi:CRISPR-associated protein Cas6
MYWQQNNTESEDFVVPDDIVDILYAIQAKTIGIDHAHALSTALLAALPWLNQEPRAGIHLIHVAESGNGWMRPDKPNHEVLHLSKRTKLRLRLPKNRLEQAKALTGQSLDIDGHRLVLGPLTVRVLSKSSTVFSRYIIDELQQSEQAFLQQQHQALTALDIKIKKMLCGKQHRHYHPSEPVITRSLMLAELDYAQSIRVQQIGLGEGRLFGCGLFLAHKDIAPVNEMYEQIPGSNFS